MLLFLLMGSYIVLLSSMAPLTPILWLNPQMIIAMHLYPLLNRHPPTHQVIIHTPVVHHIAFRDKMDLDQSRLTLMAGLTGILLWMLLQDL